MDGVAPSYIGGESDYGSDFNPDEQVILNSLLEQTQNNLASGPAVVLTDINDYEGPKSARVPRVLARKRRDSATNSRMRKASSKNRISVEIEGDHSVSAPRMSRAQLHGHAD